jgi:hydroquinone glucosyltransferase
MAELARRLVAHHALAVTLVTFADLSGDPDAHSAAVLSSLRAANISTATLPAVPLDDLPADACIETVLLEVIGRSIPHLRALLHDVGNTAAPLAALVPDFFATAALPLASELSVPGYIFFPSNLSVLAVMRSAVELNDGVGAGEYRDLSDPLPLPRAEWTPIQQGTGLRATHPRGPPVPNRCRLLGEHFLRDGSGDRGGV